LKFVISIALIFLTLVGHCQSKAEVWIDTYGYKLICKFESGMAKVKLTNGKYGLIDSFDRFLLPKAYDDVEQIKNGRLRVKERGVWFTINGYGECIDNCPDGVNIIDSNMIDSYESIEFPYFPPYLTTRVKTKLDLIAKEWRQYPSNRYVIFGHSGSCRFPGNSWTYVMAVVDYLVGTCNMDKDVLIFQYGISDGLQIVNVRKTSIGELSPTSIPPPFPNLRR